MLSKLNDREKKLAVIVAFSLVGLVFYHGVWRPVAGKMAELNDEIFSTQLAMRKAKMFLRQKKEIMAETKKYSNLQNMDARKDEEEIASLLNFIEQEARKAGVSLADVKPQSVKSDRLTKRYIVELTAESGMKEMIGLIYQLQYSPQMLKVERVEMAPKQEGSDTIRTALVVNRVVVK